VASGGTFHPVQPAVGNDACTWNICNWRHISPELNTIPKLDLLKTLLSFSRPRATPVSCEAAFNFNHTQQFHWVKALVIKYKNLAFGVHLMNQCFPAASYAIFIGLICNSHPFFRIGTYIYWLQCHSDVFSGITYNALYCILSKSKTYPKNAIPHRQVTRNRLPFSDSEK